jgi:predicted TIM-barrel fold metal-dependent hydrolase
MGIYRFDAHCHIFTLKYALKEVKSLLHDVLNGTYPFHEPDTATLKATKGRLADLKELLRQLYELIHAAGGTEEENLDFLQKEGKKAFPDDTHRIIPLMMDIFYMLAYPLNEDEEVTTAQLEGRKAAKVTEKVFQDSWNEILDDFTEYLKPPTRASKFTSKEKGNKNISQALQMVEEERSVAETLALKKLDTATQQGFYQTEGYCYHMENLVELVKTRVNELYPFVAIDPRRPGMIDTLLSGSFFKGDGRFYGVKLYPRMGYHPLSKPMDAIYKYCNDNNIPITFHCGMGGFPPSTTWKYSDFGNPIHFKPIVKKYPDLKIDFAHFGSTDPTYTWANTIMQLINDNENVYSDLSCYVSKNELTPIINQFWNSNPKLKTRLMFGTDFDVMYFTGKITMKKYYDNFKTVFTPAELTALMHDNPKRFMGI